jgi:hypothetical protein
MHPAPLPDLLDRLFSLSGGLVMPVWLLLLFVPRWQWTQRFATFIVPLKSLAQVAALFGVRQALLAGWIHYLAFDLFTGAWEARDAVQLGISRWLVAPCLLLTLLFGPVGLCLYLLLRLTLRKKLGVLPEVEAL